MDNNDLIKKALESLNNDNDDSTLLERYGNMDLSKLCNFSFKKGKMENRTFVDVFLHDNFYCQVLG